MLDQRPNLVDGSAKLHVIRKGLEVRKRLQPLFHGGTYTALYADGGREENVVAFSLHRDEQRIVAIAPRLFAHLMQDDRIDWGEAGLELPRGSYIDVMTGRKVNGGSRRVVELLDEFPVALLATT